MQQQQKITPALAIVLKHHEDLLVEWSAILVAKSSEGKLPPQLRAECSIFLKLLVSDPDVLGQFSQQRGELYEFLVDLSASRALDGSTPAETALFVLSLKQPLFNKIRQTIKETSALGQAIWDATRIFDGMALMTMDVFKQAREKVIKTQQQDMLELSTPVIRLWDGILVLPMIGTLDSARTHFVMEALLEEIVKQRAKSTILDITGVPTVDTETAQHLLKTIAAARLMGVFCFVSGIRPQIAQTMVQLGIALEDITTRSTVADALVLALAEQGIKVVRKNEVAKTAREF